MDRLPNLFKIVYPDALEKNRSLIEGIITTPWTKITSETINRLTHLKIISCFGTGIDSVESFTARKNNIIITNTPD
jgi:lactate dehydrogenase-like 2-hydroxyacid dehydrogenase